MTRDEEKKLLRHNANQIDPIAFWKWAQLVSKTLMLISASLIFLAVALMFHIVVGIVWGE